MLSLRPFRLLCASFAGLLLLLSGSQPLTAQTDDPPPPLPEDLLPPTAVTFSAPTTPVAVGQTITITGHIENLSPFPLSSIQLDVPPHSAIYYTTGPAIPPEGIPSGTLNLGDLGITQTLTLTLAAQIISAPDNGLIELPFFLRTAATDPITTTLTVSVSAPSFNETEDNDGKGIPSATSLTGEPARWQMAYTPPGASSFTGAATYQYPIAVPPGIGGLTPELSINYNSRGFEGLQAPYAASGFGVGWGMPQPQITNGNTAKMFDNDPGFNICDPFANNRFALSINGVSYQLQARPGVTRHGRYDALGDPSLFIEYKADSSTNITGEYWLVKNADGTSYLFGQSEQAEQVIGPLKDNCSQSYQNGLQPRNKNFMALSWKLESITDVYGRQIRYTYGTACSRGPDDACLRWPISTFVAENYTFASPLPHQSGNHFRREADVALYRMEYNFVSSTPQTIIQFDYTAQNWDTLRDHRWMATGRYRPDHLTITHAGQTIAGYTFAYGQLNHYTSYDDRSTTFWWLTSITPYGRDYVHSTPPTGAKLPAQTFTYEQNTNVCGPDVVGTTRCVPILSKVDNGYGGIFRFIYDRYDDTGQGNPGGDWFVVKELYTWDGVHHPYSANNTTAASRLLYERIGYAACYDKANDGCRSLAEEPSDVLVGFRGVTISTLDYINSAWVTLSKSQEEFATSLEMGYWRNGKTTLQRTLNPANNIELSRTNYEWQLQGTYGVDAQLIRLDHYIIANGNTLHTYETFAYLNGGSDFGALYEKREYDAVGVLYRCTQYDYAHQTTGGVWLVNRPLRQTLYQGNCGGNKLAETLYRYDAPTSPADTSLDGKAALEYTLVWRGATTDDTNYVTTRQTHYSSGANAGLPYDTITYNNYSSTVTFANTVRNTARVTGYNALGLPTGSQNSATGLTTLSQSVTYDSIFAWLPASATDANGAVTSYTYDKFGRLTKLIRPGDSVAAPTVSYSYWDDPSSTGDLFIKPLLVQTTYKGSNGVRQFYNGLGQLVQEQAPRSHTTYSSNSFGERDIITSYTYDARGLLTCQTMPYDVTPYVYNTLTPYRNDICTSYAHTATAYDTLGRVLTTTAPDDTATQYLYYIVNTVSVDGHTLMSLTNIKDANNHIIQHYTNSLGQLALVRELSGVGTTVDPYVSYADTRYYYDPAGNLDEVRQSLPSNTDPISWLSRTTMNYNALGQKLKMNDPDMGEWNYSYDVAGNLTRQEDERDNILCFFYDNFNRMTSKRQSEDDANCESTDTQLAVYQYGTSAGNTLGRLISVTDTSGSHTFTYDSRGRLGSETRTLIGAPAPYTMSYAYDALDRLTSQTYPNGETVTTSYNGQGLPNSLSGTSTYVDAAQYNRMGQMKLLDLGNGLKTYFGYLGYQPFAQNNQHDATWGQYGRLWRICTAPDASNRCTYAYRDATPLEQRLDMRFAYDPVGNITGISDRTNSSQVQSFTYDHLNRLTTASTNSVGISQYNHTYTYDPLGNIDSRIADGVTLDYTYGSKPHAVTSVTNSASSWHFTYDANGNMSTRADATGVYTHTFDVENRLTSVIISPTLITSTFTYDATGIRVKSSQPGQTIYYPFPGYEEEVRTPPTVNLTANGQSAIQLAANQSFTLAWNSNATSCTASGQWSGNKAPSSSQTMTAPATVGTYTYTLTCSHIGGSSSASVTVQVVPPPTLTFTVNGQSSAIVLSYTSFTLVWSSSNASSCTATNAWNGSLAVSGSTSRSHKTAGIYTYTLTCTGPAGTITKHVNVTVYTIECPLSCGGGDTHWLSPQHETIVTAPLRENMNWSSEPPAPKSHHLARPPMQSGDSTIIRTTYSLAGQAIATRVSGDPVGANNGLFFILSDHLGSTSLLTTSNGSVVPGSATWYLPFGGYRGATPTQTITDRDFTGQRENLEIGLLYYNARYYAPSLGRFISADPLVPDPANPQAYNRYAYVENRPLNFNDPTGHCKNGRGTGAGTCQVVEGGYSDPHYTAAAIVSVFPADDDPMAQTRAIYGQHTDMWDSFFRTTAGFLSEPADWILTGKEILTGEISGAEVGGALLFAALPVVQGSLGSDVGKYADDLVRGICSFGAETEVLTLTGLEAIREVDLNDLVWAYNEETGEMGWYPVVAVWSHEDPVIVFLTIDGETIVTTPNHPFFTAQGEWKQAANLQPGDEIRDADWGTGMVEAITFTATSQTMYNFTIATAHTYFVGSGRWLVHNDCKLPDGVSDFMIGHLNETELRGLYLQMNLEYERMVPRSGTYDDAVAALTAYVEKNDAQARFYNEMMNYLNEGSYSPAVIQKFKDTFWSLGE